VSVIDTVREHLGPAEIQQISQQLGVDPATAQQAVDAALPNMVAGMAGQSQTAEGASSIQSLFGSHGNVLGNLGAMLGAGAPADGGGLLGSILGRHQNDVHDEVQKTSGLDSSKTRQLLMILAPIVLGALARRHAQSTNVSADLQKEAQNAQTKSPGMGGLLGKILAHVETPRQ
jgi:hypothetical protein